MHRYTILAICILLLWVPSAVFAQTAVIDTLQINIWPEYDRPEVLVIYRFNLPDSTTLPAQMTLRIPASSGGPYNLAYMDVNEKGETVLLNLEYDSQAQGDWLDVTFLAPASSLQMEYYDPGMLRDGDSREFLFTWPADYTVQAMSIQVQQPLNAVNLKIDPDMGSGESFQDGLTYFDALIGRVEVGEQFNVLLRYDKPDNILSKSFDPVLSAEDGATRQLTTLDNALPWFLGGLGMLFITVAVVWYLIPNRGNPSLRKRHPNGSLDQPGQDNPHYCHNCGKPTKPDDIFCRSCGTKIRKN